MPYIEAKYSHIIPVNPEKVYAVIADYEEGHHAILPKEYFSSMKVLKGGQGTGTVIEVDESDNYAEDL